jgi:hypothetical protein
MVSAGDRHHHGLADGARDAEDIGRGDARDRPRHHHAQGGLQARGAHGVGALAQVHRHGADGVLGERTHVGDDHDADHESGGEHVEPRQVGHQLLQQRGHEQQGEVAVHHGGHRAQQFQHRLDDLAHAVRGVFAQVNGGDGADRDRHHQGDGGRDQGPGHQRQDAVVGVVEQRGPLGVGQEFPQRHMTEERQRLVHQHAHDAERDRHRRKRREEQQQFHRALAQVPQAKTQAELGWSGGQEAGLGLGY